MDNNQNPNYQQYGYQPKQNQQEQSNYQRYEPNGYQQPDQGYYQQPNQDYYQGYYQQQNQGYYQGYYQQPLKQPAHGMAIASMVLGILSIFIIPIVTGTLGIVLGGVAKSKGNKSGMSTAGIVCGIIGIVGWILMLMFLNELMEEIMSDFMVALPMFGL